MDTELLVALGAAFLGGIILNVMPCVLPVLTMKVFHVIETGQDDPASNRKHGLAYGAGVLFSFLVFAVVIIGIKASGERVGWGMQFQNPGFVATLCALMVIFGLNALGVFEFTVSMGGGSGGEGYGASFVNGVVASVMATPCSAPFLGSAAAFALGAGAAWYVTLSIFVSIGLGLAFPFVLISFVPAVGKVLPRPGNWMVTFKQLMGFSLLAAAVWLYGVLLSQISAGSAQWFLGFLLTLGLGLWAVEQFGGLMASTARRYGVRGAVLVMLIGAGYGMVRFEPAAASTVAGGAADMPVLTDEGKINWTGFAPARVALAKRRGRPVFMDYTAEWCVNCKANEKLVLETDTVRNALVHTNILPMKADWTNDDETIGEWLEKLGRSGIPAYAIYMPDGSVDLLPEAITPTMVAERLEKAAEKYPAEDFLSVAKACLAQSDAPESSEAVQEEAL